MVNDVSSDVTVLLEAWAKGDNAARDRLLPLLYDDLKALAAGYLRGERPDHTLQPTALVNEAYLELARQRAGWENRSHFLGVAALAMRRILVDHARARARQKRGGDQARLTLAPSMDFADRASVDLIAVDDALTTLESLHPRQASVVELRFFGGLSVEQTAEAIGVSERTVKGDWRMARAWLLKELAE